MKASSLASLSNQDEDEIKEVLKATGDQSTKVYQMYAKTLDDIHDRGVQSRQEAHSVLRWLLFSFKGQYVRRTYAAVFAKEKQVVASDLVDADMADALKRNCLHLIDVAPPFVTLRHSSLFEYLINSTEDDLLELQKKGAVKALLRLRDKHCAHGLLAARCLEYLSISKFVDPIALPGPYVTMSRLEEDDSLSKLFESKETPNDGLLFYASYFWLDHFAVALNVACSDSDHEFKLKDSLQTFLTIEGIKSWLWTLATLCGGDDDFFHNKVDSLFAVLERQHIQRFSLKRIGSVHLERC